MRDSLSLPIPAPGDGEPFPRCVRKPLAELRANPGAYFQASLPYLQILPYPTKAKEMRSAT